ncbi:MAG: phosphoribosylformylglycinamidine cyclo-ligase, partial [Candidatus Eiseniibacteriota bacterium]
LSLDSIVPELGRTLGEALLAVHRSYRKPVQLLLAKGHVTGMAHITGGGFFDNIQRILPENVEVIIEKGSWPVLPIFTVLTRLGEVEEKEAFTALNMGVGFVVFVRGDRADAVLSELRASGEDAFLIGKVTAGERRVRIE